MVRIEPVAIAGPGLSNWPHNKLGADPRNGHFHKKTKAGTQRVAETGRGLGTGFQLLGCVEGDLVRR